ncbi:MAG: hypothetical protein A2Y22_04370 [Clostridiales bacterium GWD2_32_59]|nr:MAG: hypothetical protein A2Y22_04370 [Clostridiales bacterium GWD2_32_59]
MKKKVVIGLVVLVIIAVVGYSFYAKSATKEEVKTYPVEKRDISEIVEETGIVNSYGERKIYSKVQAKPVKISFEVGDSVKKGQELITFDQTQINSQIAIANARLSQVQANYRESVKPADKERVKILEAKIRNIEVSIADLEATVKKNNDLYSQGVISNDEKRESEKQLTTMQNELIAAQNELSLITKAVSLNIRAEFEGQISEIKENIKSLQNTKADYTVYSPIDGVITEKTLKEGGLAMPGMELLEVSNMNDLYVETNILVSELKGIDIGDKATVYNEDLGLNIADCKVSKIYPKAHTKTSDLGIEQKRVTVEIELGSVSEQIKQGYDVDVKIIKNVKNGVLVIKEESVYEIDGEKYVDIYVNNETQKQKIKTGIKEGDYIEVVEGLAENENVVEVLEEVK